MRKVDFLVQAPEGEVFTDVAVGQKLQLVHQEDHSWACARQDGSIVCPVPPDGAAALRGNAAATAAAAVRSVKRAPDQPTAAVSLQVRITFPPPEEPPALQQVAPPVDDPAGFTLTTQELEHLAYDAEVRSTLQDKRLQAVMLQIDGAANREEALKQALHNPNFREFADKMLHIMKPEQCPAPP